MGMAKRGNTLRGLLGAFLGALAGAIPWFIVSYFTLNYYAILGLIIGVASGFGYRLFKGPQGMKQIVFSLSFSIFMMFLVQTALICCFNFSNQGTTIMEDIKNYFSNTSYWGFLAIGAVFCGLGTVFSLDLKDKSENDVEIEPNVAAVPGTFPGDSPVNPDADIPVAGAVIPEIEQEDQNAESLPDEEPASEEIEPAQGEDVHDEADKEEIADIQADDAESEKDDEKTENPDGQPDSIG